jgi:transcriptional regulator of acetoin/glycerol metabolism/DNA-binding CsgD family transcriptional regulator
MTTGLSPPDRLRDALRALLHDDEPREGVRDDIWTSWRRSAGSGLSPERLAVPSSDDGDADDRFVRAARPVLDSLIEDLESTTVGLVLTDRDGDILERRVPAHSLGARFDRAGLAPGFVYAEPAVGTNAIGTAIVERQPLFVRGGEHFADDLTDLACAAAPVSDPRTGQVPGIVDLTCPAPDANALMLPFARRAAHDIEERLVDDSAIAERVMMREFLSKRRGWKNPMVFANERIAITNTAAEMFVKPEDEPLLRLAAARIMEGAPADVVEVVLTSGVPIALRCEPILDGGAAVGVVMHVVVDTDRANRPLLGFGSLTDTERAIADLVAQGLTNRQVAERVFVSRYTVDFHLRSIFRKIGATTRVDLTRAVVARSATH